MNEYVYRPKNYREMMEIAQKISPEARVRMVGYNDQWEIYIPTVFNVSHELDESYQGTPAWEAYKTRDSSHDDELQRWGYKNSHRDLPIEGIADYYNFMQEKHAAWSKARDILSEAAGTTIVDYSTATKEEFIAYKVSWNQAEEQIAPEFARKLTELEEKWYGDN